MKRLAGFSSALSFGLNSTLNECYSLRHSILTGCSLVQNEADKTKIERTRTH